jgi:hypothetical protein
MLGTLVIVDFESSIQSDDVTSVTYAGIAMTKIGSYVIGGGSPTFTRWILNNAPVGGTFNITVTFTGAAPNVGINVTSYINAASVGQPDSTLVGQLAASNPTPVIFTPRADRCWISVVAFDTSGDNLTVGANCVIRTANAANAATFDTNGPYVPGNYVTISHVSAVPLVVLATAIAPVPPIAASPRPARLDARFLAD